MAMRFACLAPEGEMSSYTKSIATGFRIVCFDVDRVCCKEIELWFSLSFSLKALENAQDERLVLWVMSETFRAPRKPMHVNDPS